MDAPQFLEVDRSLKKYIRTRKKHDDASRKLLSLLVPLVTDAIALGVPEGSIVDGVTEDQIIAYVKEKINEQYTSPTMQKSRPSGRHIHDGHVTFAVSDDALVKRAIKWAVTCEVIYSEIKPRPYSLCGICCYVLTKNQ